MRKTEVQYKHELDKIHKRQGYLNKLIETAGTPEGVAFSGSSPKTIEKNVRNAKAELKRLARRESELITEMNTEECY